MGAQTSTDYYSKLNLNRAIVGELGIFFTKGLSITAQDSNIKLTSFINAFHKEKCRGVIFNRFTFFVLPCLRSNNFYYYDLSDNEYKYVDVDFVIPLGSTTGLTIYDYENNTNVTVDSLYNTGGEGSAPIESYCNVYADFNSGEMILEKNIVNSPINSYLTKGGVSCYIYHPSNNGFKMWGIANLYVKMGENYSSIGHCIVPFKYYDSGSVRELICVQILGGYTNRLMRPWPLKYPTLPFILPTMHKLDKLLGGIEQTVDVINPVDNSTIQANLFKSELYNKVISPDLDYKMSDVHYQQNYVLNGISFELIEDITIVSHFFYNINEDRIDTAGYSIGKPEKTVISPKMICLISQYLHDNYINNKTKLTFDSNKLTSLLNYKHETPDIYEYLMRNYSEEEVGTEPFTFNSTEYEFNHIDKIPTSIIDMFELELENLINQYNTKEKMIKNKLAKYKNIGKLYRDEIKKLDMEKYASIRNLILKYEELYNSILVKYIDALTSRHIEFNLSKIETDLRHRIYQLNVMKNAIERAITSYEATEEYNRLGVKHLLDIVSFRLAGISSMTGVSYVDKPLTQSQKIGNAIMTGLSIGAQTYGATGNAAAALVVAALGFMGIYFS